MSESAGFKPKRRVFVLEFEDDDLAGFVVKARSVTLGEYMEFVEMAADAGALREKSIDLSDAQGAMDMVTGMFSKFVKVITEWNLLDDDDQPVPVSVEALLGLDFQIVQALMTAWMGGVADVAGPLGGTSPTTGTGTSTDPVVEASLVGLSSLAS